LGETTLDISIILTTYNRESDCIKCLNTLLPQLTENIEVLLLDDWHIESNTLKEYCIKHTLNYIHTGIQKGGKVKWRVPGFALNIGAKLSKGSQLIIGNAEMYHISDTVKEMMKVSKNSICQPRVYDEPIKNTPLNNYQRFKRLHYGFPWFMGIPRETFFYINGYDEDFIGIGWEDTDLSRRLLKIHPFQEADCDIIHIWNYRGLGFREEAPNYSIEAYKYNEKLFNERLNTDVVRNKKRPWGILNAN